MARAVVDASVLVKWFLDEEHSSKARELLADFSAGDVELLAPAVLPFEVMNALRFGGEYSERELSQAAETIGRYGIPLRHLEGGLALRAAQLMSRVRITAYDASYAALADLEDASLLTADDRLLRALGTRVAAQHIKAYSGFNPQERRP